MSREEAKMGKMPFVFARFAASREMIPVSFTMSHA
jgi:hypothetical protein